MVYLTPALLEQGPSLDFHIVSLIFDDIVERSVYSVGLNLNQILIINPGVPVPAVDLWSFRDVIMPGILIKILYSVHHIESGIIFKYAGYIFVEMNPILPVKKKHPDTNQVRDILMIIAPAYILKPFKMFVALAYDFLYQMAGILSTVPVGMDARPLNIIEIIVYKILTNTAQFSLNGQIIIIYGSQLLPGKTDCLKFLRFNVVACQKFFLVNHPVSFLLCV